MYAVQMNICIQLSYLEDQRNLKIYNEKYLEKKIQINADVSYLPRDAG